MEAHYWCLKQQNCVLSNVVKSGLGCHTCRAQFRVTQGDSCRLSRWHPTETKHVLIRTCNSPDNKCLPASHPAEGREEGPTCRSEPSPSAVDRRAGWHSTVYLFPREMNKAISVWCCRFRQRHSPGSLLL